MPTQHNIFVRKMGDKAVIITVTDWNDFKELEKISNEKDPDFLIGGITNKNIYTGMNPSISCSISENVKDITLDTRGAGLAAIMTGSSNVGPIWGFKRLHHF